MAYRRFGLLLALVFTCHWIEAEQFAVFPERAELRSPNGQFVIRTVEHAAVRGEFSGVFRSLVIEELATGSVHEIYKYVGRVGVAWSGDNFVIVTDYVSKKTARALVFRLDRPDEYVVIDKAHLLTQVHDERRAQLERNDHVYLEVARIEGNTLMLRVWGYGTQDPQGFRFQCAYDLNEGTASCRENTENGR